MSGVSATIYANIVAVMLSVGLLVMAQRHRSKEAVENKLFISLLVLTIIWSLLYMVMMSAFGRLIPIGRTGVMLMQMLLEITVGAFAMIWFVYIDYRIFHSPDHLRRNMKIVSIPFAIVVLLNVVNFFTGILFSYDEELNYSWTSFYMVLDILRLIYFIGSLVYLEIMKRRDKRLRYLSIKSFIIPMVLYMLLLYFTAYATAALGMAIGLALMYVQNTNRLCYQDSETGFYNRLYLENLRRMIEKGEYEVNSALLFTLSEGDTKEMAELIMSQLPEESDTIRYRKDYVVTLATVKDRGPLKMLAEDVEMLFEEKGLTIAAESVLKKKKESPIEFIDRIMEYD